MSGTPVGRARGDGVIDWQRILAILQEGGFDGVLSVECGSPEQATRSLARRGLLVARAAIAVHA